MSASNHPSRSRHTASTAVRVAPPPRPSSINELVERAFTNLWDPTKDFKHWLRVAERSRNTGREYAAMGDLENAFVEYAKAATLILDKMPSHGEYAKRLNPTQKESLTLVCFLFFIFFFNTEITQARSRIVTRPRSHQADSHGTV